jgi:hypothetical protein
MGLIDRLRRIIEKECKRNHVKRIIIDKDMAENV